MTTSHPRIAIIGAGMSGLTLANTLANTLASSVQDTITIHIFEKARGVGGRMSTRFADPFFFDHGTQFFTARTQSFKKFLKPHIASGLVADWTGKVITYQADGQIKDRLWFEPHYVPVPNMNSLCKHMAMGLTITLNTEIAPLAAKTPGGWHLHDKDGNSLGHYDWVISTAPPVQTTRLFGSFLPPDHPLPRANLIGCFTVMLGFDQPLKKFQQAHRMAWMAAKVHEGPLEWMAVNSTKPGRDATRTSFTIHSNNAWAQEHIEDDIETVKQTLIARFETLTGIDTTNASYTACHRWRYALADEERALTPFIDPVLGLASTGDWCTASRIEDVWRNATALAKSLQRVLA